MSAVKEIGLFINAVIVIVVVFVKLAPPQPIVVQGVGVSVVDGVSQFDKVQLVLLHLYQPFPILCTFRRIIITKTGGGGLWSEERNTQGV